MTWSKEKEEEFFRQHEIYEKNSKKIANTNIEQVFIIFPYNQKSLWIPDDNFWLKIGKMIEDTGLLICSPNALVKAKPNLDENEYLVTTNEMVLYYWFEIQEYLKFNSNIRKITYICTDINTKRIRRDFSAIFQRDNEKKEIKEAIIPEYKVEEKIVIVPSSFWKKIYRIRELIVFNLPIWLYEFLGRR